MILESDQKEIHPLNYEVKCCARSEKLRFVHLFVLEKRDLYLEFLLLKLCKILILEDCKCCFFQDWQLAIEKKQLGNHWDISFWHFVTFQGLGIGYQDDNWMANPRLHSVTQLAVCFAKWVEEMAPWSWSHARAAYLPAISWPKTVKTSGVESNATDREMYQFKQTVSNWQCLQFPVAWNSSEVDLREKQRYKPFMMQCFIMMLKATWLFKTGTQCPLKREPHVNIKQISNASNLKKKIKQYLQIRCSHS